MKDLRAALTERVSEIEKFLADRHVERADAEVFLKENFAQIEAADRDLAETRTHLALLTGTPATLLPAHVTATGEIGLRIGALLLAPPADADAAQLRRYAGVMRALYDHATHQAVLATGAADNLEPDAARIRAQAVTDTGSLPCYLDPATGEVSPAPAAQTAGDALADQEPAPDTEMYALALIGSGHLPPAMRRQEQALFARLTVSGCYAVTVKGDHDVIVAYLVRFEDPSHILAWLGEGEEDAYLFPGNDTSALTEALDYVTAWRSRTGATTDPADPADSGQFAVVSPQEYAK